MYELASRGGRDRDWEADLDGGDVLGGGGARLDGLGIEAEEGLELGGWGGGGALIGEEERGELLLAEKAFIAAFAANEAGCDPLTGGVGGGGGVDLDGGSLGAACGGRGGAEGGGAVDGGTGAGAEGSGGVEGPEGAAAEGFLDEIGGGGTLPPGRGGGALGGIASDDCEELSGMSDAGRGMGFRGVWRNLGTRGFVGWGGLDSILCRVGRRLEGRGAVGGFGANAGGGFGAEFLELSGSEA